MGLDTKRIEEIAVEIVCRRVNLTKYLSPYIPTNDREPSWDGNIYIYNSERIANDNLTGRMPVQVKGHYTADLSRDDISFTLSTTHLENYRADGGILFFVVYFHENAEGTDYDYRIYYEEMPPVKLMHILSGCKADQKDVSIHLKTLPNNGNKFASIALNCLENCRKQASFSDAELPTEKELAEKGVLEGIQTFVSTFGSENRGISALISGDTYMYAKIKGSPIPQPLKGILSDKICFMDIDKPVSVNGIVYYEQYQVIHKEDSTTVRIGDSLTLVFKNEGSETKVKYRTSKMLRKAAIDLPFIIAAVENMGFCIGDWPFVFEKTEIDLSNFNIEQAKKDANGTSLLVEMLDKQGCTDDLDITALSDIELDNLNRLTAATVNKQLIMGLKPDLPPILRLDIGPLHFLLCFEHAGSDQTTYQISNVLDYAFPVYMGGTEGDIKLPAPISVIFKMEDYISLSNIQFERLLSAFQEFKATPYIYEMANEVMLRMVAAHDQATGIRKKKLLDTALAFAEWLESMPDDIWDKRIAILNRLQIIKRIRPFTNEEKELLYHLSVTSHDRNNILVGTYILLDQQDQAEYFLEMMDEEERENLKKYPIFHFWIEHKEHTN